MPKDLPSSPQQHDNWKLRLLHRTSQSSSGHTNALAETTIGLYKCECVRDGSPFREGPLRTLADVEKISSQWVHWYNTQRLMHRLGGRPPAEAEAAYWTGQG